MDSYFAGVQNDGCNDGTEEPFSERTVPSVCLSVSLTGNHPPKYTMAVFCLVKSYFLLRSDQHWHFRLI